jgi:hypothetical protein
MSGVVNYAPKLFADLVIIGDRVVGQLKSYCL